MSFTPVTTADGSLSCLDAETGELCHNRAGAYTEALNHYIRPSGLLEKLRATGDIRLLDACYGLGYNTWVLADEIVKTHASEPFPEPFTVSVIAIEKAPEILAFLPQVLAHPTFDNLNSKTTPLEHNIDYRTQECISNTKEGLPGDDSFAKNVVTSEACEKNIDLESLHFTINVADRGVIRIQIRVADLRAEVPKLQEDFDAVFHDPFSPQKMPELWTVDLFRQYHRLLQARMGLVLTYSSAAAIRGGLLEAGFTLGKTVPLGQKSGGTIAYAGGRPSWLPLMPSSDSAPEGVPEGAGVGEISASLPLSEAERQYLETRAGIPYRDPGLSTSRGILLEARAAEQATSDRPSGQSARKLLQL